MAGAGVVLRSAQPIARPRSARMRNIPVIPHPMTKLGDASQLMVTGTGTASSVDMRRQQTMAGYPVSLATCFSWSESDLVSTRKKRYTKKALVTGTREDGELLELVTERLVDGFQGVRQMFRAKDPSGGESVTRESLLHILYNLVGQIENDAFERMLLNLGLVKKEKISFDIFVSRFSEFEDIRKQWMTPVKRVAVADTQGKAHPEEGLRDCGVNDWAQLKVAPHAFQILHKALRQGKVDVRSLLPDECFLPGGGVTRLQMRHALLDLGVNLTDLEFRRFWERFDKRNAGFIPLPELFVLLNLTPQGEPKKQAWAATTTTTTTTTARKSASSTTNNHKKNGSQKELRFQTDQQAQGPRPAAKAARDFALRRHKGTVSMGPVAGGLGDAFRVEGIFRRPQSARLPERRGGVEEETAWEAGEDMPEAVARSKIRAVMHQKQHSKFDSILDCLHHKFEEHYISLLLAFKLFDIHDDGHLMHIDFRRVMKEFGFPVSAVQLDLLIPRFGITMKHGLIGYRQLLTKLFNHSESLTSRVIDDFMQARLEGGMEVNGEGDSEEDTIVRRLVEFIHQEYMDLALFLLRSDRRNKGVLSAAEVRAGVERCLGYLMTDKQWVELQVKLPRDADGAVRYLDFLLSFGSGAAGTWNLQAVGQVTVPRNKVVYEPTEEVRRLERAKSEMVPTSLPRKEDHRPQDQLRKELEEFFTQHLYEVEQRFRDLDRKSHKGFSQWQFGALLNLCGFPMTDHELTAFWLSQKLDGDLSTFEDVVKQFVPSYGHTAVLADKENQDGQTSRRAVYTGSTTKKTLRTTLLQSKRAATAHARPTPSPFLTQVMIKAKAAVVKNWGYLRRGFRKNDPNGLGTVSFQQMMRLVEGLRSGLSHEERSQLCEEFDLRRNGRCNYLAFMKAFSAQASARSKLVYDTHVHVMDRQPKDSADPMTINDALTRIRKMLMKQYKSLRRGFTSHDRAKGGYLSKDDFRLLLADCGVPASQQDFYHLFSEFDADMDGRVCYSEFLDALLRME
ncbi:EF-hand calcium-binding domain-containing protein 6-like [Babylonia areolata]|uniref:EF-hand calcium-binding domain-containing protein 6-like n=1 Tax=Babylonia areolata TaxID=304850 RepID=UPI003FD3413D